MSDKKTELRPIDKPLYNYFQAIYRSFYSVRLYVDVGKRWKGFGVAYLLLMMFVVSIPLALQIIRDYDRYYQTEFIDNLSKIPKLYIQNGEVSLDKPMPYMIKNDKGEVTVIVDTSGKITQIDKQYPHLTFLITKNQIIYRMNSPQLSFAIPTEQKPKDTITAYTISSNMNDVFVGSEWIKTSGIENTLLMMKLLIYPTVSFLLFFMYLVFLMAFSLMAQFVAKVLMKFTMTYKQACRLLIVSSTPQAVILIVFLVLNKIFYGFGVFLMVILSLYFSFGVVSLRSESKRLVRS